MNELKHKNQFKEILSDYQLSDGAKQILANTKLVLLVGPSSSGRNTIINELVRQGGYHPIVSDTTRQPRENNGLLEQDGREYWFKTEQELLADLRAGNFLEAAIIHDQQVSGISIRELQAAANEDKIAINEIEVVGADNIHVMKPDTKFIFVLPPSFDEWMTRRNLRGRLPDDEVRRRLESSVNEINVGLNRDYYHFLVNDTYMHAVKRLDRYIRTDVDEDSQAKAKDLAEQILHETEDFLAKLP